MKPAKEAIPNTKLKLAREKSEWTQEEVAEKIGVVPNTYSRYETGKTFPPPNARKKLTALFKKTEQELGLSEENYKKFKTHTPTSRMTSHLTSFIGHKKEREIVQVYKTLLDPAVSLLTLTGPYGVGKTELAWQVKQWLEIDGVFEIIKFISLEEVNINDTAKVLSLIADTFRLPECKDEDLILEQLSKEINNKATLIILDPFEHVLKSEAVCKGLRRQMREDKIGKRAW